jgi:hypothetical protein
MNKDQHILGVHLCWQAGPHWSTYKELSTSVAGTDIFTEVSPKMTGWKRIRKEVYSQVKCSEEIVYVARPTWLKEEYLKRGLPAL